MNRKRRLRVIGYAAIALGIFPLAIGGMLSKAVIPDPWPMPHWERTQFIANLISGGGLLLILGAILRCAGEPSKQPTVEAAKPKK
jgi:hypothetical protein